MFRLCESNQVGRSLFATQRIPQGTLVLSDSQCLLRFHPDKMAPLDALLASNASESEEDQAAGWFAPLSGADFIRRYRSLPALALAAVAVIDATMKESESPPSKALLSTWRHIREMHCPQLPLSHDTLLLMESCKELLRRAVATDAVAQCWDLCSGSDGSAAASGGEEDEEDRAVRVEATAAAALLHAVMAMKTNCHRSTDNLWCLFPLASKLAHSCDPNCYFVGPSPDNGYTASFVAMRDVAKNEVLSFSYFGGPSLSLSTFQRRSRLSRSHLFVCRCERCEHGDDWAGAIALPACPRKLCRESKQQSESTTSVVLVRMSCPLGLPDADAPMGASWRCTSCQGRVADAELPAEAQRLRLQARCALEDRECSPVALFLSDAAPKLRYAAIVAAVRRATTHPLTARVVGDSLLTEACRQATVYFGSMCAMSQKAALLGIKSNKNGAAAAAESGVVAKKKATPYQLLFCWAMRFFRSLHHAGVINKDTRVGSPPHMLVVATTLQLIDAAMTGGNTQFDVQLAEDATPATALLAVLARHVRPVVEATSKVQFVPAPASTATATAATAAAATAAVQAAQQSNKRKVEKVRVLCELEWHDAEIEKLPLYEVLCMSCADEWRKMSCGRKCDAPRTAKAVQEVEELEQRGGLDAGFEQLLAAWEL